MDRRTHHRLAQPLPPLGQGLGVPQPKGLGVLAPRLNPPHAEKALSKKSMIPDRLLGPIRATLRSPRGFDLLRVGLSIALRVSPSRGTSLSPHRDAVHTPKHR